MEREYASLNRKLDGIKRLAEIKTEIAYWKNVLKNPGKPVATAYPGVSTLSATNRSKLMTLSADERQRIYQRKIKEISDAKELYDYRKEKANQKQIEKTGLCFTQSSEPAKTTLFL